jgi:hypothetical protein
LEKKKLKFSDIDSLSDLSKKIEGEVTDDEIKKEADLYHQELYTVIPKSHEQSLGIFPDYQQLSHSSILLWDTIKGIPTSVADSDYKVLKVTINSKIVRESLKSLNGGVYTLKHIPNSLPMEEVDSISYKGE